MFLLLNILIPKHHLLHLFVAVALLSHRTNIVKILTSLIEVLLMR
jgi:hypothetical protein